MRSKVVLNIKKINTLKEILLVTLAIFVIAFSFNAFFFPFNMVIGGSSGVAIIVNYLFSIEPFITIFGFNLLLFLISYCFLEKRELFKSLYGVILFPIFVKITLPISDYMLSLNVLQTDLLVVVLIGAVISGVAIGVNHKYGYTTGGIEMISRIVNKWFGLPIGRSNFIFNFIIILIGAFVIGFDKLLYTILILYVRSFTTDKILLGEYSMKIFYIITKENNKVKKYIAEYLNLKVTEVESIGGYSKENFKILMCVVSNRDYYKLKEGLGSIDKKAFFLVTQAHN